MMKADEVRELVERITTVGWRVYDEYSEYDGYDKTLDALYGYAALLERVERVREWHKYVIDRASKDPNGDVRMDHMQLSNTLFEVFSILDGKDGE